MPDDFTEIPQPSRLDAAYHLLKIALGIGGTIASLSTGLPVSIPAADFMSALLDPPVTRRRNEFMELLAQKVVKMESQVEQFNIEDLAANENFISAVLHALNIAIRNHQKEKLEALANAVVNTAINNSIEDDIKAIFLHLVDRLTPSHITLLKYFNNPRQWKEERNAASLCMVGGWIENFNECFPDFADKRYAFYWTIQDLMNLELLREKPDDSYRVANLLGQTSDAKPLSQVREEKIAYKEELKMRNIIDIWNIEMTILGQSFLNFIENPIEADSGSEE